MNRRPEGALEFIQPDSWPGDGAETAETAANRRPRWIEVGLVGALVVVGLWWLSEHDTTSNEPAAPSPTSIAAPIPTAQGARSEQPGAHILRQADQRVLAVVTDRPGNEARLVSITAESTEVVDLPPLDNFAFDASGRWLAATSVARLSEIRQILWVAPVGGSFEPVALDVRGFAWHDEQDGHIAWTTDPRDTVFSLDLETPSEVSAAEPLALPVNGALRGWGAWGYAIQTSYRISASTVVDSSGAVVMDELAGVYSGRWHDGRLLFSGGRSPSTFVDIDTWESSVVPFVDADDVVWTLAASETETVALVADRGVRSAPFDGSIVRSVDGITGFEAAAASAYTRLAWLDNAVLFAEQGVLAELDGQDGSTLTVLTVDDERIELPLPTVFDGRVWIAAIAVAVDGGS